MLRRVMQMCVRGFGQRWYENVLQTGLVGWCSGARLRSVVARGAGVVLRWGSSGGCVRVVCLLGVGAGDEEKQKQKQRSRALWVIVRFEKC